LLGLRGWVDVVNIERAHVCEAADLALAAELADQREFPLPVSHGFTRDPINLVPLALLAINRTVARGAWLPAVLAFAITVPTVSQITGLATVLSRAVAKAVRVHFRGLATPGADDQNWCGSHSKSLAHFVPIDPGYFDIARRRIDAALREPSMFIAPPKPAEQLSIVDRAEA
jgi:hypothetical protein